MCPREKGGQRMDRIFVYKDESSENALQHKISDEKDQFLSMSLI